MKKRVLSLLLVVLMIMSLVPTSAFAANDVVPYGVTGGYLYFDRSTGEIVDCDETVTEAAIPSVIRDKEVKRIAAYAFEDCNVLKRITIPSNLTLLSEQAFFGCGGLESIEVDKSNSAFLSEGGVLFSKDRAALYVYPCNKPDEIYTIPSSVICIYDNAFFANTRAKKIVISENTRVIGNGAFFSCDSLEEIFVPKCVESIGYAAFSCCERLENISVAKDNPSYREIDGVVFSNDMTILEGYPAGKTDTTYVIPNGVKYIGGWAFGACDQLINITLPDGIIFVGASAFYECTGLRSITLLIHFVKVVLRNFPAIVHNKPLDFIAHSFLAGGAEVDFHPIGRVSDFLHNIGLFCFLYGQRGSGCGDAAVAGVVVHRLSFP